MFKTLICAALLTSTIATAQAAEFKFVALGDKPYGKAEEVNPLYETLIETINARAPKLVLHVGDIKSGSTLCDDEMLDTQLGYLNSFESAVLYAPGDNEWTDCHREKAGGFDPLERLAYIRKTYFADPSMSLGKKPIAVQSQAIAVEFDKPVLLVYGDSHIFRVTRPFPKTAPNITGLEVFGSADMHAVEVSVDTNDPAVFGFKSVYNPALPLRVKK